MNVDNDETQCKVKQYSELDPWQRKYSDIQGNKQVVLERGAPINLATFQIKKKRQIGIGRSGFLKIHDRLKDLQSVHHQASRNSALWLDSASCVGGF